MHGKNDQIIPFTMGKELFEKANEPKYFYSPVDDHMLSYNDKLIKTIKQFIEKY